MGVWLDISGYQDQRGPIDFARLRADGVEGVFIKASEGTSTSPYFLRDAQAAHDAGLLVGGYAFTRPDLGAPEPQADTFGAILAQAGAILSTWADDAETGGSAGASSWGDWHGRFCARVDTHVAIRPEDTFLYSAAWCERFGWGFDARVTGRRLWVAQYGGSAPGPLPGWSAVALWQDRSNASYPGIVGAVDEDITQVAMPSFVPASGGPRTVAHPGTPIVASAVTPHGDGTYDVEQDGGLWPSGNAPTFAPGSLVGVPHNGTVVDFALHHDANGVVDGYWFLCSDGGVFPFGQAPGWGSCGGVHLNAPAVRLVVHPAMTGYAIVTADGGWWPFGPQPPTGGSLV